jgi:hypothetical protein
MSIWHMFTRHGDAEMHQDRVWKVVKMNTLLSLSRPLTALRWVLLRAGPRLRAHCKDLERIGELLEKLMTMAMNSIGHIGAIGWHILTWRFIVGQRNLGQSWTYVCI